MALLGSSVDPRLFVQDYSGFARAAEIQGQGMANLGAAIGQGIKDFGEAREERKKLDAQVKADDVSIESAIKLGKSLGIDINSYLEPIQALRKDPNTTPAESLALGRAAAQGISNAFTLGIGAQEREIAAQRAKAEAGYKQGMLGAAQTRAAASLLGAQQAAQPSYTFKEYNVKNPVTGEMEKKELPVNPKTARPRDIEANKDIINVQDWYEYKGGFAPDESTSQVMPSDGMFGFTYKTRDLLPASTANARQISLDFNAAANKNAKGIEIIIPNNATSIERALAMDYVNQTKEFFASKGVDVPVRGVKTAAENKRGSANRFHTEPFFVNDSASRAAIESDPDGYAQVLANTIGKIPGAMFIPPHKSNDPGASANGINERDFAKGTIIPALERLSQQKSQTAGTLDQRAQIARMVEEGAGMATAQNMPQGAVPTEASLTNQQVQPAQPQVRLRSGFAPVKAQGEKPTTMMTAEQVRNLAAQGYKVSAIPTVDGNFMVSGVTAGGQTPRYTKTPEEDLQSQRLTTLDKEQADLRASGLNASQDIAQLKGITNLLDTSVKTGFGRETIMRTKRVLGMDVSNEEQFQSLVGNEAMKNIALTKGAISDREMDYFKNVLSPNMGKTTEGNKKILEFRIRFSERASKIAKTISDLQSKGISPFEIQKQVDSIIETEPLFDSSTSNIAPQNQAESDANFLEGYGKGE